MSTQNATLSRLFPEKYCDFSSNYAPGEKSMNGHDGTTCGKRGIVAFIFGSPSKTT
jgi:hypothetical protein